LDVPWTSSLNPAPTAILLFFFVTEKTTLTSRPWCRFGTAFFTWIRRVFSDRGTKVRDPFLFPPRFYREKNLKKVPNVHPFAARSRALKRFFPYGSRFSPSPQRSSTAPAVLFFANGQA